MTRALVIGGGSGIGAAVVAQYRAKDVPVVVWDIAGDPDHECDITDPDAIDRALDATLDAGEVPDQITVTSGIGRSGLLIDVPPEAWDKVMDVNAKGVWLAMRAVARALIAAGRPGSFVAVSSVSGHLVDRNTGMYCASKAAVDMIVQIAAAEWAEHGLRVNAVAPGVTKTPMLGRARAGDGWLREVEGRTAMGRLGEAGEVAEAVHALHGLGWVTGQILDVDGGLGLYSPIDSYGFIRRNRPPE